MAISATVYAPSQFRIAVALESTFGTAETTQGDFYELDTLEPTHWDATPAVEDVRKRNNGKIVEDYRDYYRSRYGGMTVIPFSIVCTADTIPFIIEAAIQDQVSYTNTADTKYTGIWELDSASTSPDFSAGSGHSGGATLLTVLGYDPAENWVVPSCVVRDLRFSWAPGSNGGRLVASGNFVSGFTVDHSSVTATPGSWHSPGVVYFTTPNLNTMQLGGGDIVPYSFEIGISPDIVRVGHDTNGDAQTYRVKGWKVDGSLVTKLDANTVGVIDDAYDENPAAGSSESNIFFEFGADDAIGWLQFDINAILTIPNPRAFGEEQGVGIPINFVGVDDGTNEAIEIKAAHDGDKGLARS